MKLIILLATILITLLSVSPISAYDEPTTNKKIEKVSSKREDIKLRVNEKKEGIVNRLSAARKERVMNFSSKLIVRLEATVERLQKLINRIEKRIVKIEEESEAIDTESLKTKLDTAKETLALIKVDIESLKASLNNVPSSDDPKVAFEEVRTLTGKIKENLKKVHSTLIEVVKDIKGLRLGEHK